MRQSHYCGDYTALTTTKWGAKIYVDTRDTSLAPHIMVEGDWEPWVTNAIATVLQQNKGCVFIDVGANVGWYTLLAAGLGASRVWAFEPNPRMVELLRKTLAVNGFRERVTLAAVACGDDTLTQAHLRIDPEEAGGAHLFGTSMPPGSFSYEREPKVEVVCLDDVVAVLVATQLIIKVDVEGYEPQVLAGAWRIVERLRPILFIEHHRDEQHTDMLARLQHLGYELRGIQRSGHPTAPMTIAEAAGLDDAETIMCTCKKG